MKVEKLLYSVPMEVVDTKKTDFIPFQHSGHVALPPTSQKPYIPNVFLNPFAILVGNRKDETVPPLETQMKSEPCQISTKLWTLFKVMSYIGYLRISKHPKSMPLPGQRYSAKLFSMDSLRTLAIQLVMFYACGKAVNMNGVFSEANSVWLKVSLALCGVIQIFLYSILSWVRMSSTAGLLNGWDLLEKEYFETFRKQMDTGQVFLRINLYFWSHFSIPSGGFLCIALLGYHNWDLQNVLIITIITASVGGMMAIEALFFVVCDLLSTFLSSICEQLQEEVENNERKKITSQSILQWKSLLSLFGNQIRTNNAWLSSYGVCVSLLRIVAISTSSYILLQLTSLAYLSVQPQEGWLQEEDSISIVIFFSVVAIGGGLAFTMAEAYFAEKISHGKERLLDILSVVDTTRLEIDVKFEFKSLIETVEMRIKKVSYYDTVAVDWRLILSILSSAITYLIVFLQFKPSI